MSALPYVSVRIPGGTLTVVVGATESGADVVLGSSFRGIGDIRGRLESELTFRKAALESVTSVITRYCDGYFPALDEVAVAQHGGPFQQAVWRAMREIPAGAVESYGEVARRAGRARAYRAVGTACAVNITAPFVPCHRVVAAGGLGGYGYGLEVKIALLAHEGVVFESDRPQVTR